MELEWFEDEDNRYQIFADVGPFTLTVHSVGQWWIEDAVGDELCKGYAPEGCETAKNEVVSELRLRLRMAAETLDSSWLEAKREDEEEPNDNSKCTTTFDCPHCHEMAAITYQRKLDQALTESIGDVDESDDDYTVFPGSPFYAQELEETYEDAVNRLMTEGAAHREFVFLNGREPNEEELARTIEWVKSPLPAGTNSIGDVDESDDDFKDLQEAPEFFFENLSSSAGQQLKCTEAQWKLVSGVDSSPSGYDQILASIKAESLMVKL